MTDNMPPLPEMCWDFLPSEKQACYDYARTYAEQRMARAGAVVVIIGDTGHYVSEAVAAKLKDYEQQTEKLIAEKAILEKASSDNFALYYEAKRDRKELRAQVEELKAKIHCQDTYILELLTKLKDKQ